MYYLSKLLTPAFIQETTSLTIAIVYSLILPILWLTFCLWLNRNHPRRKGFLLTAFFVGAIAVVPTLPVEQFIATLSKNNTTLTILWAASEELLKFGAFMFVAYKGKSFNGPRDYALTSVTAALGFAGFENVLYILHPVLMQNITQAALSGSMRFVGANLLHAICSSFAGLALGFAYFKSRPKKILYACVGIMIATTLHSLFNLQIQNANQIQSLYIFGVLWIVAGISAIFWIFLSKMEEPTFVKDIWMNSLIENEKLFSSLSSKLNFSPSDETPLHDIFQQKGISTGTDYDDLKKICDFLQTSYELSLRRQGMNKTDSKKSAENTISENISAKTISFIFDLLKKKDSSFTLGKPKIDTFGENEE